jgi:hypothetical protein
LWFSVHSIILKQSGRFVNNPESEQLVF